MTMHNVALAILIAAGVVRHDRHRQRRELEQSPRFVASLDSFCREWCLGQDDGRGDDSGYEGFLTKPDRRGEQ